MIILCRIIFQWSKFLRVIFHEKILVFTSSLKFICCFEIENRNDSVIVTDKRCWLVSIVQDVFKPRCPLPSDYYPWMVVSHFVAIGVLILRFSDFDTAKRNVFSFDGDLKLPDYFVVFFMISICEVSLSVFFFTVLDIIGMFKYAY